MELIILILFIQCLRYKINNPVLIYSWVSFIYLFSYQILFYLNVHQNNNEDLLIKIFIINILFIEIGYNLFGKYKSSSKEKYFQRNIKLFHKIITYSLVIFFSCALFSIGGKSKIDNSGNILMSITSSFFNLSILSSAILLSKYKNYKNLIFIFILCLFALFFIGERNFTFHILFILFLSLNRVRNLHGIYMLIFIPFMLIMVFLSTYFKNFYNNEQSFQVDNPIVEVFQGEFIIVGRNFDKYFKMGGDYKPSLLDDLSRSIIPLNLFGSENSVTKFNKYYYPNNYYFKGKGLGLGLLLEWYSLYKFYGVALIGFLYGLVFSRFKSYGYNYNGNLLFLFPIMLFSLRADTSYILSPMFKNIFLYYFSIIMFNSLVKNFNLKTKINYREKFKKSTNCK